MSAQNTNTSDEHAHDTHEGGMSKARIWKVFFILLVLTVIEFIIALWAIPGGHMTQHIGNYVYIILTLFKAFYIIAYFMHLKFEKVSFQVVLGSSFFLIVYLIILMLIEGNFLFDHMPRV